MQKLTKDGVVKPNHWQIISKEDGINLEELKEGHWLVCADVFLSDTETLEAMPNVGIWLDAGDEVGPIQEYLKKTSIIAINFPVFADGRGFSLAQQLKSELDFQGEILAIGHFMDEQLFYLKRCGVDSFALTEGSNIDAMGLILKDFTNNYQGSPIEPRPLFRRR